MRDWALRSRTVVIFPYSNEIVFRPEELMLKWWWPLRTRLWARATFGKQSYREAGRHFGEYHQIPRERNLSPLCITFAEVATHNHFVLERGGKVLNQTAPMIKLPADATESDYLTLLGLLNSSVACFWMKQVFHNKGSTVDTHGARQTTDAFENFYQYAGTGLKMFPIPASRPNNRAESLNSLVAKRQRHLPQQLADSFPMHPNDVDAHCDTATELLGRMIAHQEDLDWECYRLYGIIDEHCSYRPHASDTLGPPDAPYEPDAPPKYTRREPPPIALGERAFEIVMARRMAAGELETTWFSRHGSTPTTELPAHWPDDYRTLVEHRIELIETNRFIGLIEKPEYKRRWNVESWHDQEQRALRTWLLNQLESPAYWPATRLVTVRTLAEQAATDTDFQRVATRYAGHAGVDLGILIESLVESEGVPALPVQRYKPSGLAKRTDWERTWLLQRREDKIDADVEATTPRREDESEEQYATRVQTEQRRRKQQEIGDVTPPPKYRSADFLKPTCWRLRGALDVPRERFVSLPNMSRDSDPTLLVGWAGWNALELCRAVATYCAEVIEQDGWPPERLTPLLAILQENLPWLKQWHNEVDPEYNQRLGDFFETYLHSQLSILGLTEDDLRAWTPPAIDRRRRTRRRTGNVHGPAVPGPRLPSTG